MKSSPPKSAAAASGKFRLQGGNQRLLRQPLNYFAVREDFQKTTADFADGADGWRDSIFSSSHPRHSRNPRFLFGLRLSRAGFHSSFNQVDSDFDPFCPISVRNSLSQHDLAMVDRFPLRASTCAGQTLANHPPDRGLWLTESTTTGGCRQPRIFIPRNSYLPGSPHSEELIEVTPMVIFTTRHRCSSYKSTAFYVSKFDPNEPNPTSVELC